MSKRKCGASLSEGVGKRQSQCLVSVQEDSTDEGSSSEELQEISAESITIAIFCALSYEVVTVKYSLDEEFTCRPKRIGPMNYVYSFGRIGEHNIVIARPHQMGTVKAAQCAATVSQQFSNVRFALMVGIGAGIPNLPKCDIRLGDIAVSIPQGNHPGVIQYDFGKYEQDGFVLKGSLDKPPPILISADGSLEEDEMMGKRPLRKILKEITKNHGFARPNASDVLFEKDFHHVNKGADCSGCEASSEKKLVPRPLRQQQQPLIHRGLILSGNGVVKDPEHRDYLHRGYNTAICFEMEAAGIMDEIPCLVVRGICDYADTHKQDGWHYYAAAVAAAYCKALLRKVNGQDVKQTGSMKELIEGLDGLTEKVTNIQDTQRHALFTAKLPIAAGAAFDSYDNQHTECLPGTRVELLRGVEDWTRSPHGKCIFWLNGMAGTGKSTISRTVAGRLKQQHLLGASFFFKRGEEDRGTAKKLFPTLVDQLVISIPHMFPKVQKAIDEDPNVSEKVLREQFEKLLLNPLLGIKQSEDTTTRVIVIDALDECDSENDIQVILRLLPQLQKTTSVQLRFFITSRPELSIMLGFTEITGVYQDFVLHKIPKPVIEHDISLYFKDQLRHLRQERSFASDWPGDATFEILIERAVPLFIAAATLCRFICDPKWNPKTRLEEILSDQSTYVSKMDSIYVPVLKQLLTGQDKEESQQLLEDFKRIVGAVIVLATPLSINGLSRLLDREREDVKCRLGQLHSVLSVPNDFNTPVRLLHLSFRDFLLDHKKIKGQFWINKKDVNQNLTAQCLQTMQRSLRKNICNLPSEGTQCNEIGRFSVGHYIPSELQYSCRYWAQHLVQSQDPVTELIEAFSFLKEHFLHWLEAMSILGYMSEVVVTIKRLESLIQGDNHSDISGFLYDARRFVLKNRQMADIAPLQLYSSGLIFAPNNSIIKKQFHSELAAWGQLRQVEENWSGELQALEGHSDSVWSVAFSPNGQLLASGSGDNTVRLWDPSTGDLRQTLEGHSDSILSVAFSPNGQLLASCSNENIVRLWDPSTGDLCQTLEGHSHWVSSVAFSPNGQLLASGSNDGTVRLWDLITGDLCQTLEGHSNGVSSVAFSPSGQLLASGSYDKTIRLWDLITGDLCQTLESYSNSILSVAFSPNGQLLASGSSDNTVRLWDLITGEPCQTLEGHSHWVSSAAFSPNGKLLVSGSYDNTVKLWDPSTGDLCQTLESHSRPVWSESNAEISILENQWICFQGRRVLWLPAQYRPTCLEFKAGILGLGHSYGRVSFISNFV